MEPGEQNAYLLAFFNYVVAKLTKKTIKTARPVQSQWSNV